MSQLTGQQIIELNIVSNAICTKVDDGHTPSYGCDAALYTLTGAVAWIYFMLPPFASTTFKTFEKITMPFNCSGTLSLKSTYSRQGIILVTNSPVDPGYEGDLTIRLFNSSDTTVTLFGAGGFMQLEVHLLDKETSMPYKGRWM